MMSIKQAADAAAVGTDFSQSAHLTMTGLEYNPYVTPSPGVLANPVYDCGRGSIYIWVARLIDNHGFLATSARAAIPPITDPSFLLNHTNQIQCMIFPVVPSESLAGFFSNGRIREGDRVLVSSIRDQQLGEDGSEVLIGGTADKVHFHGDFNLLPRPKKDDHPRGT